MPKIKSEPVERVTIKLGKSVAAYFRQAFPHGRRSDFVTRCILRYQHEEEVRVMEDELRRMARHRQ